jgi:hypothetical protein
MLQARVRSREAQLQIGAVALIVAAIFVNLLELDFKPGRHAYYPLARFHTADITEIAKARAKLRKRYGLFFELGRKFSGSTLIVPHASPLDPAFLAGALAYGRVAHVVASPLDANAIWSELDYGSSVVAQGKHDDGDWFIATAGPDADVFIVLNHARKMVLLDLSLLVKSQDKPRD